MKVLFATEADTLELTLSHSSFCENVGTSTEEISLSQDVYVTLVSDFSVE